MYGATTASLVISGASLLASIVATVIAKSSLRLTNISVQKADESIEQAQKVSDRAHDEWAQQKWFDLYFKTNIAYDLLDEIQSRFSIVDHKLSGVGWEEYHAKAIRLLREVQGMAVVFPECTIITNLCNATAPGDNPWELLSKQRLEQLMDAMEEVRRKALVNSSVLDRVVT